MILLKTCSSIKPDFTLAPMLEDRRRKHLSKASDHHLLETGKEGVLFLAENCCQNQPVTTASSSILKRSISPAALGKSRGAPGPQQPGTALPCAGSCSPGRRISTAALAAARWSPSYLQGYIQGAFSPLICKICPFSSLTLRPLCHQQCSLIAVGTVDRIN